MSIIPIAELSDSIIKISFKYDPILVAQVREITRARWNPAIKSWVMPYSETSLDALKIIFPNLQFGDALKEKIDKRALNALETEELKYLPKVKNAVIKDFVFHTKPFWHQNVSFNFARSLNASALFLEQGLGKAKLGIDLATWRFRKKQVGRVLVVCPNSVMGQWVEEIEKHGHPDFSNYILLEGSCIKRQKILAELLDAWSGFLIINYEGLLPLQTFLFLRQRSANPLFEMIILDESSRIKHAQSQRSKITWRLGITVKYRNILTGTPITQSAEDIFSQYRFLDPGIFGPYATAFRGMYLIMGGFELRAVIGYKNIENLMKKIYSVAIRFTKDRCLDLPAKIYEKREARMDEISSKKYKEFEKECVAEFDGKVVVAPLVMTKLMKLYQITGGFIYEQGPDGKKIATHDLKKNPKLTDLEELLDEVLHKKIIIWCRFVRELELISALLKKKKIQFTSISGSVKQKDRAEAVRLFQNDNKCKVFLGQIATAGFGITLHAAEVVIYYSNSYSYEERIQSEDRCHRIGLKHAVTYIDLVAVLANGRKTIDSDILDVVQDKARFANEVSRMLMQKMVTRSGDKCEVKFMSNKTIDEEIAMGEDVL